jgi:hypothetical protein
MRRMHAMDISDTNDWGLPDWTKEAAYPRPAGTPITVWAWQFLRRWPAYHVFWLEKIQPFLNKDDDCISRDIGGRWWPYHDELRTQFGVDIPSAPWTDQHGAIFAASYVTWTEGPRISLKGNEVALIIDLERPLKQQFVAGLKSLEREQEFRQIVIRKSRRVAVNYTTYLRILDADHAGAQRRRMINVLFPHSPGRSGNDLSRLLCDYRKAAQRLRDGGYRTLLENR